MTLKKILQLSKILISDLQLRLLRMAAEILRLNLSPERLLLNPKEKVMIASLGKDSGYVPYTAFSAKKSYLKENPDVIQRFTNALQKGMDYVRSHSPSETASVIKPQFPETTLEMITTIVTRYYEQDTWKSNLIFEESSFDLLQDILESAGELEKRAPYKDLITTEFAENAAK